MTTYDFITELFCRVDDQMKEVPKDSRAKLYPSEVVTLGILFALKGVGNRAFYRWLTRDYLSLFPHLPERTRLFRLFSAHHGWTERFMAEPSVLGLADTYSISLVHPARAGRSSKQIGRFGISNKVWVFGGKLCFVLNKWGLVCGWDASTANVKDTVFHPLIRSFEDRMVVLADHGFYSAQGLPGYPKKRRGWAQPNPANPSNLKICKAKDWNSRMLVETVLSMLTTVCHAKKMSHRVWSYFKARLAYTMAMFNILAQWYGAPALHLSIASFSL